MTRPCTAAADRTAPATLTDRDRDWADEVAGAVERGRAGLLARREPDGHWVGELQGDTILESEFILLLAFLGEHDDPRVALAANYLRAKQLPDGGWANYPGGPAEVSVSVKAYFALKIAGRRGRRAAHGAGRRRDPRARRGGDDQQLHAVLPRAARPVPVRRVPVGAAGDDAPAALVLLQHLRDVGWTRTIVVPLAVVDAHKPVTKLPESMHIRELFLEPPETPRWPAKPTAKWFSWTNFFLGVDWVLKKVERLASGAASGAGPCARPSRGCASTSRESDGLGAIFPPMIYTRSC